MSSVSLPALSVFPRPCHPVPISSCPAGGGPHRSSFSAFIGLSPSLRLQVPRLGRGWGSAVSPPLHPCLSLIVLQARPPPSVPLKSQASSISASLPHLSSPALPPLRFPRTLYPSPDRLRAPGRPGRPFFWGRGKRRGRPPHLAPALPPPSPSARLYKANRPLYSAAPRAGLPRPPYMAWRLRSAPGPALGGGGATLGSASCPSTRPLPAPSSSPEDPPDPGSQSQLPISCLWNPGKSHPEPQCCPLSNGAGTPPWAVLKGLFQWVGDFKLAALEKLIPWGTRAASSGAQF